MTKRPAQTSRSEVPLTGAERQRRYRANCGGLVSIDIPPDAATLLGKLRRQTDATTATVIVRALELLQDDIEKAAGRRNRPPFPGRSIRHRVA